MTLEFDGRKVDAMHEVVYIYTGDEDGDARFIRRMTQEELAVLLTRKDIKLVSVNASTPVPFRPKRKKK